MSVDSYFCFCCLATQDLKNLFSGSDNNFNYVDLVYELCGVKPSSELKDDSYICEECITIMNDIYKFKEQVKETVNILQINGLLELRKIKGELILTKVVNYSDGSNEYIKLLQNKNIDIKVIKVEVEEEDFKPEKHTNRPKILPKLRKVEREQLELEQDGTDNNFFQFLPIKEEDFKPEKHTNRSKILPKLIKVKREQLELEQDRTDDNFLPIKLVKVEPALSSKILEIEVARHKYECKECFAVLPNAYTYHQHMNVHFPNNICDICGKAFELKMQLNRHLTTHEKGPFKCKKCDAVFNKRNTMTAHMKKHNLLSTYRCPFCPLRFTSYFRRVSHLVVEHNQPSDRHKCQVCGKGFPLSASLREHLYRKHFHIKRHMCSECGEGFYKKSDYEAHTTKHTGQYRYHCDQCGNKYPRKKSLRVHMLTHLLVKPYSCGNCGKGFTQKRAMTNHVTQQVCLRRVYEETTVNESYLNKEANIF